jgi:hypothetical protein
MLFSGVVIVHIAELSPQVQMRPPRPVPTPAKTTIAKLQTGYPNDFTKQAWRVTVKFLYLVHQRPALWGHGQRALHSESDRFAG